MSKVAFLYTIGTTYLTAQMAKAADLVPTVPGSGNSALVAGLNGVTAVWGGGPPADPFPSLLDPNIFDAKKVFYPAAGLGMAASIDAGIQNVVNEINNLPAGQKFCLGGYSQGAAVMSGVYNELRSGSLTSRNADMIGATMFGNPRRQVDYRGSVGGTWSGSFNVPGSTTGGHGSFPATGPYARLSGCESSRWIEFAAPLDIFSSVATTGGTTLERNLGIDWVSGNDIFLGSASLQQWATYLLAGGAIAISSAIAISIGNAAQTMTDAAGTVFSWLGGNGHTTYPFVPPVGDPDNGLTAYQIALKFLTTKANEYATAPILLPPTPSSTTGAGWSTTLVTPAV
ncbi:cutinase family protein [Mycolicibacterium sp.]|uniref:cutinase family protein n=1 Tax=Mycolicibacterium sp. TaxID=2320850 RepID=UPI0028A8AD94|nr:PE-PPE domain-containing protein [Mycolicibacterium sp.]